MKIAWLLLISLFLVFILHDGECWRSRRLRIRIRVRRVTRKILPRIRGRKLIRNIGNAVKKGVKTLAKVAILTSPELFLAKKVFDQYKKYKQLKAIAAAGGANLPTCTGSDVCGGACNEDTGACRWHCANTCSIIKDDEIVNWPGLIVTVPCKFEEYDYSGIGYFEPADLAWHMNERGKERDNMMVFNRLDLNGDGRVTRAEFATTKDLLLKQDDNC